MKIENTNIDIIKTGNRIKQFIYENGYTVKQIQDYLQLACPQSVYRWIRGEKLPTVDHLYSLSVLFGIHMEDLLVPVKVADERACLHYRRMHTYYQKLCAA